jgi:CheY-like chemotaxis protein
MKKKIRQILINLLGNAFKFTERGQVTLRLKVVDSTAHILPMHRRDRAELRETVAQQELIMLFEVIDTGPGISPENLSKIFQPFVQTEVGKKVAGGTGLGLSISQKFAELLGGELTVNSVVGQGSSFQCYLPVMVPKTDKFFSLVQPVKLQPRQEIYRILVVDDEPTNRFLLVEFLKELEVEVRSVENGMQAIAESMTWLPHLIWMDIRMPIMNGYEATKKIREIQTDCPPKIIAMTANPLELEENSIFQSEFDDFVGKPFTQKTIFAKMSDHLGITYVGKR